MCVYTYIYAESRKYVNKHFITITFCPCVLIPFSQKYVYISDTRYEHWITL